MGKQSPQVGKAWMSLARMYQHLSATSAPSRVARGSRGTDEMKEEEETEEGRLVREGAASALARAMAVARELSAEHPQLLPQMAPLESSQQGFAYLVERVQRQRQLIEEEGGVAHRHSHHLQGGGLQMAVAR